ncbi:MAG: hypothetical protein IJO49_01355, partial [Clostridia bacterium]|nr:hypothetical protein [Clostridia bacterium]
QLISEDSVEVGRTSFLELLADSDKHIIAEGNTAFKLHSTGTETSGNITIDLLYGKSLFTIDNKLPDGFEYCAGVIQQYIFHYARTNKITFEDKK